MRRKVRQGGVRRVIEDSEGVGIPNIFVRINQAADELVVTVGRESVYLVELARDRFRIEPIQSQDFCAYGRILPNRIHARKS